MSRTNHGAHSPAPPVVLPAETRCPECGEACDPRYLGQEWGQWKDDVGAMRSVHKWCAETWIAKQLARSAPSEPEGETPSDGALERMNEWDSRVDDAAAEADLRTVRAELTALRAVREAAERVAATGYVLGPDWYGVSADALSTLRTVLLRAALASSRSETGATTEVPNAGL